MDMQEMFDAMSAQWQSERAREQMTLGELITELERRPEDMTIDGVSSDYHSYRGYYHDLSFEPGTCTVSALLEAARSALGSTLPGYKGGDYTMYKNTLVWVSDYGTSYGHALHGFVCEEALKPILVDDDD